jgi:hypothetical protein
VNTAVNLGYLKPLDFLNILIEVLTDSRKAVYPGDGCILFMDCKVVTYI